MKTQRNTQPLTSVEWDTCWMAIRYAMNRRSAASAALPTDLLAAYYDRWTDGQKEMIVRDLRENLEDLKRWNDTEEAYFGDKGIDHPIWMRFLLTLDKSKHVMLTLTDGSKVTCFEYEGRYYPVSGRRWWEGPGITTVMKEAVIFIQ